jgi:hypothetical protein
MPSPLKMLASHEIALVAGLPETPAGKALVKAIEAERMERVAELDRSGRDASSDVLRSITSENRGLKRVLTLIADCQKVVDKVQTET